MIQTMRPRLTPCLIFWLAGVLLTLGLIAAIGVPWWIELHSLSERIDTDRDQILRYQRIVATLPALQAELSQERSNDDFKAYSFDEPTPALAGATLQRSVQEMIRAVGARPISAQILPTQEAESPPRVKIRVQIQADTEQLFDLLYRIEEARPFLFVEQLSIRATASRTRRIRGRRTPVQANPQDQLTVRLDVFGYSLGTSS
jgi:general secretion pathway protein M